MINKSYFKYFDARGGLITLLTNRLRFSSPKHFNDPYDLNFKHEPPFNADEMRFVTATSLLKTFREGKIPPLIQQLADKKGKTLPNPNVFKQSDEELLLHFLGEGTDLPKIHREHFHKITEEVNRVLADFREDHFVYCLTTTATNLHLWDNYADNYRGVVLKFNCVKELDNVFLVAEEVKYSETPPPYGTKEEWIELMTTGVPLDHKRVYKERMLTKSLNWKQEQEWRIVIPYPESRGKNYEYVGFRPQELSGIYIGPQTPELEMGAILSLKRFKYPGTPVFQTTLNENGLVEFKEIT